MAQQSSKPIHVLHIVGNPVGGIRKHIHSILLNLDASRFTFSYAYSTVAADAMFQEELKNIKKVSAGLLPLVIKKTPSILDVVNLLKIGRYLAATNVDIVHGHGAKGGFYARILGRFFGLKTIYTPHGGTVHSMFSWAGEKLYTGVERTLFRWTDYFLFESLYTANAYKAKVQKTPLHWQINYNGVRKAVESCQLRATRAAAAGTKIGVFGLLRPEKGQGYAIAALAQVLAKGYNVSLHMFGTGPDRGRLKRLVDILQLQDRVIFYGDVIEVANYMREMDIILIPSLYESFSYVAVEAMTLVKPIIAARVGGLCEVVEDGASGLLVEAASPTQLAEAILMYLNDPDRAQNYAAAGYRRFQKLFTEERMCQVIADTYINLMERTVVQGGVGGETDCTRRT